MKVILNLKPEKKDDAPKEPKKTNVAKWCVGSLPQDR